MATTICYQIDQIFSPKWMTSPWVWIKDISVIQSNYYLEWILCFFSADSDKPSSHMEINQTRSFLLLGFTEDPDLQPLFFGLFQFLYLVTFAGNLAIILAIISDPHLHTPMYFFLSNLSFANINFTSTTIPKMLWNIQTQSKVITYEGCIIQIFFFFVFGCLDILILSVMAYDRFVAICYPLHYMVIINPWVCGLLTLGSWCLSVTSSLL